LRSRVNSTVSDVSRKLGRGAEAVEGILNRWGHESVDWGSLKALGVVGRDEIALKKGHRDFVTIVSAQPPGGALTVPDRSKETVKGFVASIPDRLKATLTRACTDRDEGCINAVREVLPHACVVIDRCHVAKAYRACADQLRKQELERLKAALPNAEHAALKGTLWPFRKPWADLSPEEHEKLNRLFTLAPALKAAHGLRAILTFIFDAPLSQAKARDDLKGWASLVKESGLTCLTASSRPWTSASTR